MVIWFTGLSSAGKTTIASAVEEKLTKEGFRVQLLDGDQMRRGLCRDLGFSREDRNENVRRIGFVASLLERHEIIVLVAAISPFRDGREQVRNICDEFIEIYVNAPVTVCEDRDLKGLYARARRGEITLFTGVDSPYEAPIAADLECRTDKEAINESVDKTLSFVKSRLTAHQAGRSPNQSATKA